MEQKRPKGRGLEEVAHFFFSSTPTEQPVTPSPSNSAEAEETSPKIVALVSLVPGLPTTVLTTNLAIELAYHQRKILIADTSWTPFNIFFAMGQERPFTPIEHFLTGMTRELVTTGPFGLRVLTFPLTRERITLLRALRPTSLFPSLLREERKNDVLLVNMRGPIESTSRWGGPQGRAYMPLATRAEENDLEIFSEALEIILLVPSNIVGLKAGYCFVKSLFRNNSRSRIGILLYHLQNGVGPSERFQRMDEAATKFLGRKLKTYGFLEHDPQLYRSLMRGVPLCRLPGGDPHRIILAELANKISQELTGKPALSEMLRASSPWGDRRLLLETLSAPGPPSSKHTSSESLHREEEAFFDRP